MSAPTKLSLYNNALLDVGERQLASLTEAREPRRLLDIAWDAGAVDWCLEQGKWDFATRTIRIDYSPSVEPPFGYTRAFDKPTDWLSTVMVASDENFRVRLDQFVDEAGFWFANLDTLYVRYISNAVQFGADLSKWPQSFQRLVTSYLSAEIASKVTQDKEKLDKLEKALAQNLIIARGRHEREENAASIQWCLEQAMWDFATRSVAIAAVVSPTLPAGYIKAFAKPTDWVRTAIVCSDSLFRQPLIDYIDEAGNWYTTQPVATTTLYVRYVSNAAAYGNDVTKWPQSFLRFVNAYREFDEETKGGASEERLKMLWASVQLALADARQKHERVENATAVQWCLEQGSWNFALRSIKATYDPAIVRSFGFHRGFTKPTDWVRTAAVTSDEYFRTPLLNYADEAGQWLADLDNIYVRYVSNDPTYGNNYARWPQSFLKAVTAKRLYDSAVDSGDQAKIAVAKKAMDSALTDALSKDAMNEPTKFAPPGSWTLSRRGRRTRFDRGNSGSLIG